MSTSNTIKVRQKLYWGNMPSTLRHGARCTTRTYLLVAVLVVVDQTLEVAQMSRPVRHLSQVLLTGSCLELEVDVGKVVCMGWRAPAPHHLQEGLPHGPVVQCRVGAVPLLIQELLGHLGRLISDSTPVCVVTCALSVDTLSHPELALDQIQCIALHCTLLFADKKLEMCTHCFGHCTVHREHGSALQHSCTMQRQCCPSLGCELSKQQAYRMSRINYYILRHDETRARTAVWTPNLQHSIRKRQG